MGTSVSINKTKQIETMPSQNRDEVVTVFYKTQLNQP